MYRKGWKKMVYQHGGVVWAFRVLEDTGCLYDVSLVKINASHSFKVEVIDLDTKKALLVIRYFIVDRRFNRRTPRSPVINNSYFDKLMAIDGLPSNCKYIDGSPCIRDDAVTKIFENVFEMGFMRGLGEKKDGSVNVYIGKLINIALSHDVTVDSVRKIVSNVYKLGAWCGEKW